MPENAAAEGGFGRDAPSRSDNKDTGGAREDKETRDKQAESFERAMDNANRPDRAPAAPLATTPDSDGGHDDNPTDKSDDRNDHGFFDRVADMLTAPQTDAEGNARSTSPLADRINKTKSYSIDGLRSVFADDPGLTPEQSRTLADWSAVIDGVVIQASYPRHTAPEPPSPLHGAAALADAELAVSIEVHERETAARISEIDERITEIDRQGISPIDAHIAKERIDLGQERQRLSESLVSPDAVEKALRNGDEKIDMSADVLEKVVAGRDNLAKQIKEKEGELQSAALSDVVLINEELQALQGADESMLDIGLAYQDLVDQEAKLAAGDTVHISRTRPQPWSEFLANEAIGGMVGFGAGQAAKVPKYVDYIVDAISGTAVSQQLHKQQDEVLEGVVSVRHRDDGVYEITVSEPHDPNATWASKISYYEITQNGEVWSTGTRLDGGNLQGNPVVESYRERVDDLDLGMLTNGNLEMIDGTIRIAPDVREQVERILSGKPSRP